MTGYDIRSDRTGVFVNRIFQCPVCRERAQGLRITGVKDWRVIEGKFHHAKGICSGSMKVPGMAAAMDLLRLAIEANAQAFRKTAA